MLCPGCTHVVVHYGEIALKKKNRPFFEAALLRNLRRRLAERVHWLHGRLLIELAPDSDAGRIAAVLSKTFGIANFAFARKAALDLDDIISASLELARPSEAASFKIAARRAYKKFPYKSVQVNERVGAAVVAACGKRVNLSEPELTISIEITHDAAYIYSEVVRGLGGLPVGVSGPVVALMSGGIDSPVAAIKAMKRGCKCILVHFHNYTFYKDLVRQKIIRLAEVLSAYNHATKLVIVPFLEVQRAIVQEVAPEYRMIAYRRAMLRIAGRIADAEGAKAFVTGDNLGQVASQTLENLSAINAVARRPVLAPLIAYDKSETVQLARQFGTYEISTRRYNDCCSAFLARHPETRARTEVIEAMEEDIDFDALVGKAVEEAEVIFCPDALALAAAAAAQPGAAE